MTADKIYAAIEYEDEYVQPLILAALRNRLPPDLLVLINDTTEVPPSARVLQWRQYESIDFDNLVSNPKTSLANSYVIRKALIRKHYLSTTVAHWLAKHPDTALKDHVKPSVEFEVDYADFLDEALVEAWDLKESWVRNDSNESEEKAREWWILKPGMSDRGQGIRLFSSEDELKAIFEQWDALSDDDDNDNDGSNNEDEDISVKSLANVPGAETHANGIVTSQLRHFVAQPYIHPPLLLPEPHTSAGRKFHIRTYVLAFGALKVYVYKPMLALFAADPYNAPDLTANDHLSSHLTNTCLQTGEREGSVHAFWALPSSLSSFPATQDWREGVFSQIRITTAEIFLAAARSMGIHFQPLPNAFELFALDFMLDDKSTVWLMEVNSFPDFKQTGQDLKVLIEGLFQDVVDVAVQPFFYPNHENPETRDSTGVGNMVSVLDMDLGRR